MAALRNAYLDALGIDRWVPRVAHDAGDSRQLAARLLEQAPESLAAFAPVLEPTPRTPATLPPAGDWPTLRERVAGCVACDLCKTRTQTVFGVGNTRAEWLIMGEGAGGEEEGEGGGVGGRGGEGGEG